MKSTGYAVPTGVKRSRFSGDEFVLGLYETQARLVKVLFCESLDLNVRRGALNTLGSQHQHNSAVVKILKEHWEPLGEDLREKPVVFPESPRRN
jgi:hypothetical protein